MHESRSKAGSSNHDQPPSDFVCFLPNHGRPVRFVSNEGGKYSKWIWNGEWFYSKDIEKEKALGYFRDLNNDTALLFSGSPPVKSGE